MIGGKQHQLRDARTPSRAEVCGSWLLGVLGECKGTSSCAPRRLPASTAAAFASSAAVRARRAIARSESSSESAVDAGEGRTASGDNIGSANIGELRLFSAADRREASAGELLTSYPLSPRDRKREEPELPRNDAEIRFSGRVDAAASDPGSGESPAGITSSAFSATIGDGDELTSFRSTSWGGVSSISMECLCAFAFTLRSLLVRTRRRSFSRIRRKPT
jgi:hypothetical protein